MPLDSPADTKRKLLLSALSLFADQGIEAVSMRMINREAGTRNHSALHYHFGNKQILIEELMKFIQDWFEEVREEELTCVEAKVEQGQTCVRELLRAFIAPYFQLLNEGKWGRDAIKLLARNEFEGSPEIRKISKRFASDLVTRETKLLTRCIPDIPEKLLLQRFHFFTDSVILGLANYESLKYSFLGDMSVNSHEELENLYLDYGAAGMAADIVS